MDIGNAVYFVTGRQTTGAGVPAVIRGLYEKLTARAYTAAILRVCYSAWETLDRQGRTPGSLRKADLVRVLAGAGLAQSTAEMCARLCWDVDWSAKSPLSAWLKAVRSFYLPQ